MPDQSSNPPAAGNVRLRAVSESDLLIFYEQQLDPAATRMAAFPAREREAHMAHWHKIQAQAGVINRTILFDEQVAGNIVSWDQAGKRELGYWLGRQYWGQGIATRALALFLAQVSARPLYAHVAKHNLASQRVLQKCGFIHDSEDRGFPVEPGGEPVEEWIVVLW